jgi:LmbE family N-acetylglucosaminyl deacetylase
MILDEKSKYLFLFAHPDDDAFIGGTVKMLLDKGAEAHCAWLTSGDYFRKGQRREVELAKTTALLGLADFQVHLLRLPDLGLVANMDRAAVMVTELVARLKPDTVFVTAFEGGHPDHDSTNFLAYEGLKRAALSATLFEFPLYNGCGPAHHWRWRVNSFPPGGPPTLHNPLTGAAVDCKYRIMRTYSSQWMFMIPAGLACPRSRLIKQGEPYRVCPPLRDHTLPPHPGRLNYERWFNWFMKLSFDDFRKAVLRTRRSGM